MKSPVDVKAVLDAVSDTEEARSKAVRVHLYLDDTAPDDVKNMVAAAFKTNVGNATVLIDGYPTDGRMPDALADMAVLVAGEDWQTGMLVGDLRSLNTPAVVVTTMPSTVQRLAEESKYPLLSEDVICPRTDDRADEPRSLQREPIALTAGMASQMCDDLGAWIVDVFTESRLAFANAFPFVRRPLSLESVRSTSVQNAGIGLVVILPGADMPLMTLNQIKMLLQIAAAYGQPLTLARAKEMLGVIGGAFGCRALARQLASVFPGIGWAIKAGIGYGGTMAMGHALIEYFEADGDVERLAARAYEASQGIAPALGVNPGDSLQDNLNHAAQALGQRVQESAGTAVKQAVPFARSVVKAAGDATGLTEADLATAAKMTFGSMGNAVAKVVKPRA